MIYSLGWPSLHPVAAQGSPIDELSERSYPNHFAENLKGGKVCIFAVSQVVMYRESTSSD